MNLGSGKGSTSSSPLKTGDVVSDKFPAGLRVMVVDDDPTCLRILERMLRACLYEGAYSLSFFLLGTQKRNAICLFFSMFMWSWIVLVLVNHLQLCLVMEFLLQTCCLIGWLL